ncbi:5'-deoxynucleotidase [Paenibacillus sp. N1-5-1-14]|uniref:5'-deoxynucleotidase n=1 Tax=Paenibacillus radicibacter TaxID=2972488 RepID=UPI002158F27B|nr:5'-deoxynucleotidase [Paenibacillus radicibacter]MCR8643726.1 5'-deoxynucleotidase [Paenibacillus radicibacter]
MTSDFLAYMYRLRYIERWSLMRNVVKENVAEHSYHVATLTHLLCSIANAEFGRNLNSGLAVSMALFHDATESFTGDIPTPVKHHNPDMLSSFREIERLAAVRLQDMIPPKLQSVYAPLLTHSDEDEELRAFVKAADLLDAYLKCVTELSAGNREFGTAKKQIEQSLHQLGLPEVDYFLEHFAPSMEKTLDELSE